MDHVVVRRNDHCIGFRLRQRLEREGVLHRGEARERADGGIRRAVAVEEAELDAGLAPVVGGDGLPRLVEGAPPEHGLGVCRPEVPE